MGPITFKRQRSKSSSGTKEAAHGCPMGFVRPDLVSRCTWKAGVSKQDTKTMTQGPHSIDKP